MFSKHFSTLIFNSLEMETRVITSVSRKAHRFKSRKNNLADKRGKAYFLWKSLHKKRIYL